MARLLFEEQGIRTRRGRLAFGVEYVVYTDSAGAVLADISATSGGSSIASSTVTATDIDGLGPAAFRFYGPPSGQDTLYLRCPADTSLGVQEIEADTDERLDALEGGGGGGGAHPNLAVHDALGLATDVELGTHAADTTGVHGIADTSTLATDAEVASAVSTHAADTDPHGDRAYADSVAQGLDVKAAVRVASTANLTLSGEQTIDGVLTSASRVLVKNQTDGAENGIYVSAAGAWSRAADADTAAEVDAGTFAFVSEGTVNGGTGWAQTTPAPITLGTTALVFSQFSSGGTIIGGAGLVKTGNTLDVVAGTGLTVAADSVGIAPGGITNTQINASAAIAESKLALSFPTHAEDHAARHAAVGADPLTGYATGADLSTHVGAVDPHGGYVLESAHTLAVHDALGLATDAELATHAAAADPHTGYATDAELATHSADTTSVHGIADTAQVALRNAANTFTADNYFKTGRPWIDVRAYGALGDVQTITTGAMTAAGATLTSGSSVFVAGDVGKVVYVPGAGVAGAPLLTTISAFISATQVTLATAAGTTVSGKNVSWGTDDCAAVQAAVTAAGTLRATVLFPAGTYMLYVNATGAGWRSITPAGFHPMRYGVLVPSNVRIASTNAVLFCPFNGTTTLHQAVAFALATGTEFVTFEGLKFDGLADGTGAESEHHGILVADNCNDIGVSDCVFTRLYGKGALFLDNTGALTLERIRFQRNYTTLCAAQAATLVGVRDAHVTDNFTEDNLITAAETFIFTTTNGVVFENNTSRNWGSLCELKGSTGHTNLRVRNNLVVTAAPEGAGDIHTITASVPLFQAEFCNNVIDVSATAGLGGIGMVGGTVACTNVKISGNTILRGSGVRQGIVLAPSAAGSKGIQVDNNRVVGGNAGFAGIQVTDNMDDVSVQGNVLTDCTLFLRNLTDAVIAGNMVAGAAVSVTSVTGIVRNNKGWTTEASGVDSVASGTTTKAVTHGLSVTPALKDITVTPNNNPTNNVRHWVSAVSSTTFTVSASADPGVSGLSFAWRAVVL